MLHSLGLFRIASMLENWHQMVGIWLGTIYMSRTECEICAVVAMRSTSMSLLPQCSRAPTERHGSPVEAVLSGSEVVLPGLVEIPKSPDVGRRN